MRIRIRSLDFTASREDLIGLRLTWWIVEAFASYGSWWLNRTGVCW